MSDEWIKMRCNLADDPAVIAIASAVRTSEAEVVGLLHRLWSWADQHTPDGCAKGVNAAWVDRHVGKRGFAAAMAAVSPPWLEIVSTGIIFPHFETHNGTPAKRRAQDQKQKAWERRNGRREDVPPDKRRKKVRKMSSSDEDENKTLGGPEVEVEVELKDLKNIVGLAPDATPLASAEPKINGHNQASDDRRDLAEGVLEFLNLKAHRRFRPVPANVDPIVARFKEGFTPLECRQVVVKKIREWGHDEKMEEFIRPKTLFNRTNFANYAGELVPDNGAQDAA